MLNFPMFGRKRFQQPSPEAIENERLTRHVWQAEMRYLGVLRRELGHLIVTNDPNLMLRVYQRALQHNGHLKKNKDLFIAEEAALVAKYPSFDDFDFLEFFPFTSYGHFEYDIQELIDWYLEISKMLLFVRNRYDQLKHDEMFSKREQEAIYKITKKTVDRSFKKKLISAMRLYEVYRQGYEKATNAISFGISYESAEVCVYYQNALVTTRYNIFFPKENQTGYYERFVFDDGRSSEQYGRCRENGEDEPFVGI